MIPLDTLTPLQHQVGYGGLGTGGNLGYEAKHVTVRRVDYTHALSTHPPARLLYFLGGAASSFRSHVALNDDVAHSGAYADFAVLADGREVASATGVWAGAPPQAIEGDVSGAQLLELVVTTSQWEYCHAVWLDPEIDDAPLPEQRGTIVDPIARAEIEVPPPLGPVKRCVATVASPGWEQLLDDMLGSVVANGDCPDALLVVFLLGTSAECERVVAKYRAVPVHCRPLVPPDKGSKSVLYSVASVVDAEQYVCLDSDTLVLDRLSPVFEAIEAAPDGSVLRLSRSERSALLRSVRCTVADLRRQPRRSAGDPRPRRRRSRHIPTRRERRVLRRIAGGTADARRHDQRHARSDSVGRRR